MSELLRCACGHVVHAGPLACPDCGRPPEDELMPMPFLLRVGDATVKVGILSGTDEQERLFVIIHDEHAPAEAGVLGIWLADIVQHWINARGIKGAFAQSRAKSDVLELFRAELLHPTSMAREHFAEDDEA